MNNRGEKFIDNIKKDKLKENWFLISIIIFFVLLLSVITFLVFFDNNVTGCWSRSDSGAAYVLTFKGDGTVTVSKDSMSIEGKYSLKENNVIDFDVQMNSRSFMTGEYQYNIISNFSDKKLELINDKGDKEEYSQCRPVEFETVKDFSVVEALIGRWKSTEFGIEYEFYDNGISTLRKDNMLITFNYNADDKIITLKGKFAGESKENEVEYTLEDNILKIGGVEYIKQ